MIRRPPRSTRTDTLCPYTTLFRSLQRCVLVGSSAVWGPSDDWVNEDTPVQRAGFRAESLLDAEAVLKALPDPGIGTTLRLAGLYGPDRMRLIDGLRSEERRVGKECVSTCRSRWSPYH